MTRQTFSLFQSLYIDYRGHLCRLSVSFLIGKDKLLYFQCSLDERETYSIRLGEDGRWYDQRSGPTVLADELGSIIEGKLF